MILSQRNRLILALLSLSLLVGVSIVLSVVLPPTISLFVAPTAAAILVFAAFSIVLQQMVGGSIFGELGFLYLGFMLAYTVMPAVGFMLAGLDQLGPLAALLPEPPRLVTHLWRHVLFEAAIAIGYLLLRGRLSASGTPIPDRPERDGRTIVALAVLLVLSIASLNLMSAPVHSYYDHYARYDHLPWLERKFTSVALRLSLGLYCVLLTFLFRSYAKYKWTIPLVVLAICAHEMVYSLGARIQALIVLLQAVCLYHFLVRRVSLKTGFIACVAMAALFSVVEAIRPLQDDTNVGVSALTQEGLKPASEFGAVYYPGFHLYEEREARALPPVEWPMFFADVVSLVTFGDFERWNPMNWYASNYYPSAEIPPFTMGPIADSALWGGEPDLLVRGLLNGLFFAFIMRWFLRNRHKWWALTIYVYCYATCILTLKYTIFLQVGLVEKNLLPTLLMLQAIRLADFSMKRRRGVEPKGATLAVPLPSR